MAMICIEGLCQEHLLPAPGPQTRAQCEAGAGRADAWAAARDGASVQSTRCAPLDELLPLAAAVTEISPGAFVHTGLIADTTPANGGDISNHGFIIGATSVAVIDAGYSRALGEALYLAVRAHTDKPISHVIFTHMHPDHALGGDVFLEAGAEGIGAPKFQTAYDNRVIGYIDAQTRIIGAERGHGTFGLVTTREVEAGVIDLGDRPLRLQSYPTAHTTNDMTILDEKAETIWMGDLTFLGHTPALDGSIKGWIAVLEMFQSDAAKHLVPGHGPARVAYPDGTNPTLSYLKALAADMRAAIAKGDSLQTALKDGGDDLRGDWKVFDAFHLRNATNAYIELEWE